MKPTPYNLQAHWKYKESFRKKIQIIEYRLTEFIQLPHICVADTATCHIVGSFWSCFQAFYYLVFIILTKIGEWHFLVKCLCYRNLFGKLKLNDPPIIRVRNFLCFFYINSNLIGMFKHSCSISFGNFYIASLVHVFVAKKLKNYDYSHYSVHKKKQIWNASYKHDTIITIRPVQLS